MVSAPKGIFGKRKSLVGRTKDPFLASAVGAVCLYWIPISTGENGKRLSP